MHETCLNTLSLVSAPASQVGEVSEGELFRVETIDWTGGQIADDDCADDIKHVDLTQVWTGGSRNSCKPRVFQRQGWLRLANKGKRIEHLGRSMPQHATACHSTPQHDKHVGSSSVCEFACCLCMQVHYLSGPIRVVDAEGKPAQPGEG